MNAHVGFLQLAGLGCVGNVEKRRQAEGRTVLVVHRCEEAGGEHDGGTATEKGVTNIDIGAEDVEALVAYARDNAIGLTIVGLERMQAVAEWGGGLEPTVLRVVGLVAAGLGAFIVWSVWPRRSES